MPNQLNPSYESMLSVYLGTFSLSKKDSLPSKKYSVERIKIHENYDASNAYFNDIALLKLKNEAELSIYVQVACIPTLDQEDYPTEVYLDSFIAG